MLDGFTLLAQNTAAKEQGLPARVGYARNCVCLVQDQAGALQKVLIDRINQEQQVVDASTISRMAERVQDDADFWATVLSQGRGKIGEGNSRMVHTDLFRVTNHA
jgi:hypothetical protein